MANTLEKNGGVCSFGPRLRNLCESYDITWVCLKIGNTPKPNGFADHYPVSKWLFHWEYTLFPDKPTCSLCACVLQVLLQLLSRLCLSCWFQRGYISLSKWFRNIKRNFAGFEPKRSDTACPSVLLLQFLSKPCLNTLRRFENAILRFLINRKALLVKVCVDTSSRSLKRFQPIARPYTCNPSSIAACEALHWLYTRCIQTFWRNMRRFPSQN